MKYTSIKCTVHVGNNLANKWNDECAINANMCMIICLPHKHRKMQDFRLKDIPLKDEKLTYGKA